MNIECACTAATAAQVAAEAARERQLEEARAAREALQSTLAALKNRYASLERDVRVPARIS